MIVRLKGGLGNQMFQYALGRALAEKKHEKLWLDIRDFEKDRLRKYELDKQNISKVYYNGFSLSMYAIIGRFCKKIGNRKMINRLLRVCGEEKEFLVQSITSERYLDGYWQNINYFKDIRPMLVNEFRYTGSLTQLQNQVIINMQNENSVAMHVRRGDYLTGAAAELYVILNRDYYDVAMDYLRSKIADLKIYVFSDDIEWCKKEFSDLSDAVFVDSSISTNQHVDLELMKNCKHFIIANSTFSWWASWLTNYNEKIVIAPYHWFKNEQLNCRIQQALLSDAVLL